MAEPPAAVSELLPHALAFDPATFDFGHIPSGAGVFLLETEGEPFIGKSAALRRRLQRLLGPDAPSGRRLKLRTTTGAVHYRSTGSAFETSVLLYKTLRAVFPGRYRQMLRLRLPPLLKVTLANAYPRCIITRRLGRGPALYYGPFPSRAAAEKFSSEFLDLFLVRRCVEEIQPDPVHPGCIYGDMRMCLRPCQAVSTAEQYREEVARLTAFLSSHGASLLKATEAERDRASEELDFEAAARLHKRADKIQHAIKQSPDLARDLECLHGIVIQTAAGHHKHAVELFPVWRGFLLPQITFSLEVVEGKPVSMDARLREALAGIRFRGGRSHTRAEHLALLARWYYRGTRKGEFVPFDSYDQIPYRKVVGAISRVTRQGTGEPDGASNGA